MAKVTSKFSDVKYLIPGSLMSFNKRDVNWFIQHNLLVCGRSVLVKPEEETGPIHYTLDVDIGDLIKNDRKFPKSLTVQQKLLQYSNFTFNIGQQLRPRYICLSDILLLLRYETIKTNSKDIIRAEFLFSRKQKTCVIYFNPKDLYRCFTFLFLPPEHDLFDDELKFDNLDPIDQWLTKKYGVFGKFFRLRSSLQYEVVPGVKGCKLLHSFLHPLNNDMNKSQKTYADIDDYFFGVAALRSVLSRELLAIVEQRGKIYSMSLELYGNEVKALPL